jgi:type I restriction enzyme S subunit
VGANGVGCHRATRFIRRCGPPHFPTFRVDPEKVLPAYLSWYFKSPSFWEDSENASQGSTGRNQIKRRTFLAIEIPLPALDDQRRIISQIDSLSTRIEEAIRLRREASQQCDNLLRSILFCDTSATPVLMDELVRQRTPDVVVEPSETYRFAGVYSFGRGLFCSVQKQGMQFSYARLSRLRAGDFTYPKLMAWEGALGVVPEECDGLVVSPEFPVFEINRDKVLPEVLDVYFRTPSVWPKLSGASTGTNVRRRRLNPADFLKHIMPLPTPSTQAKLRETKQKIESTRQLRATTEVELNAMLPAILDRAFRGKL